MWDSRLGFAGINAKEELIKSNNINHYQLHGLAFHRLSLAAIAQTPKYQNNDPVNTKTD